MALRRLPCLSACLLALLAAVPLGAAERVVLVAGGGEGGDGSAAAGAKLVQPFSAEVGEGGVLYISEDTGHRVRSVDARGILGTVAGTGAKGTAGIGGPATAAQLNRPHHLLPTPRGLLIADTFNARICRLDASSGRLELFAGAGKGFGGDGGPAAAARFGDVYSLALSPDRERLYVADLDNRRIRAIDLGDGTVSTVAGNGEKGVPRDGAPAVSAPLVDPRAVAVDAQGRIWIAERGGHALRVVDTDGAIRTVAGTGKAGGGGDGGDALAASFNGPKHLCIDRDGSVLIVDTENHVVRRYLPRQRMVVRVVGTGKAGGGPPGAPLQTALDRPHGVALAADGGLLIADSNNHRVLKLVR